MSTVEAKPTNEALAIRTESTQQLARPASFAPTTFDDALRFSDMVAKSDLAPKDFKGKPANVFIAIQMGAEVGLSPMQAIQNIAVINGRPSLWGDAALAVVQAHKDYEWHEECFENSGDQRTAVFKIKRKGGKVHETRFGVAEARKAGLATKDGPWKNYPDRMMQMRARGFGIRDQFADALRGMNIAEEAMDAPPVDDVPAIQVQPALPAVNEQEKKLQEECEALMVAEGMNVAQRQAKFGQYPGKLSELKEKLVARKAAKKPAVESPAPATKENNQPPAAQPVQAAAANDNSNGFSF